MRHRFALISFAAGLCLAALAVPAAAGAKPGSGSGGVALHRVGNFDHPVYLTGAPGSPRLVYVVEQPGRIKVIRRGHKLRRSFLNISGRVDYDGAERGLLSMAFAPGYRRNHLLYVYYTNSVGNIEVDEFHARSSTRAAAGSRRRVIVIPHPGQSNHNGGQLQFHGRYHYLGTGDGGSGGDPPGNAQNKNVLLGKLIRIDPRNPPGPRSYSIPPSNPFVGRPGRNQIFAYGLRNPFRFSFDRRGPAGTRIAIGDVGQDRFEEVDYLPVNRANGANFGWNHYEGFAHFEAPFIGGTTKPIFAYGHSRGCAVIGGYVIRSRALRTLNGRYLYSDNCDGTLRSFVPRLGRARGDRPLGVSVSSPTSFGIDERGRYYVCSLNGPVYRLVRR